MIDSVFAISSAPLRGPRWLLGDQLGAQVWIVNEASPFEASVLIRPGVTIVLLASRVAGSPREGGAIRWALALIAAGDHGYYERERDAA